MAEGEQDGSREIPRPYPMLTPENAFFWTAGKDGVLRFKRCRSCGYYLHPPAPYCPQCRSNDIAVEAVSGEATVAAKTINYHPWHPALPPPYALAIVEIAEAPYVRLTTRIVNCPLEDVRIGMRVRVVFEQVGPTWLPYFEPVD
jgi:uncharacterized OB-fold protein